MNEIDWKIYTLVWVGGLIVFALGILVGWLIAI